MACFIVPGGEAVAVTLLSKVVENHYKKTGRYDPDSGYTSKFAKIVQKRKWLTGLLWGGCALLAFEHLWHGGNRSLFSIFNGSVYGRGYASDVERNGKSRKCNVRFYY